MNIRAYRMAQVLIDHVVCGRTRRALDEVRHLVVQLRKRRRPLPRWFKVGAVVARPSVLRGGRRGPPDVGRSYVVVKLSRVADGGYDVSLLPQCAGRPSVGTSPPVSYSLDGYPPFPFVRIRDGWRPPPAWFRQGVVVEKRDPKVKRGEGAWYEVVMVEWEPKSRCFLSTLKCLELGRGLQDMNRLLVSGYDGYGKFEWRLVGKVPSGGSPRDVEVSRSSGRGRS